MIVDSAASDAAMGCSGSGSGYANTGVGVKNHGKVFEKRQKTVWNGGIVGAGHQILLFLLFVMVGKHFFWLCFCVLQSE